MGTFLVIICDNIIRKNDNNKRKGLSFPSSMETANIILCYENQLSPRKAGLSPFNHMTRLTARESVYEFSRCDRIGLQTLRLITQTQIYEDEHKHRKTRDSSATPLLLRSTAEIELREYSEFCKEHQKQLLNVEYFNYFGQHNIK